MRPNRWLVVLLFALAACSSKSNNGPHKPQCSDGKDNDGDGMVDFPDDPGCTSASDDSEDSQPSPQCMDGRDNDGDGKIDYPNDPGCVAPQQDDEKDDCPDGPTCPQCSNGKDDDGNGFIDFPQDPGCQSAADPDEYTVDATACGANVHIKQLPFNNEAMGTLTANTGSLAGSCGGGGSEDVYLLHLTEPKVIVASTDNAGTAADTVLYIRGAMCTDASTELACDDDVAMNDTRSEVTAALQPGTYYLVVDAKDASTSGAYDLTVKYFAGTGSPCQSTNDCGPGLVCKTPPGGTQMVCSLQACRDGVDNDMDGKTDFPFDPGCDTPMDDDESDTCPTGPGCPQCGDGIDNDGDGQIDYPSDTSCKSASGTSEACMSSEGVTALTMPMTTGDNSSAADDYQPSCAFGTGGKDLTYQLSVPKLTSLSITVDSSSFFPDYVLLDSTCGGTELACTTFGAISEGQLAAGDYYLVVDGDDSSQFGSFTITVAGTIAGGQSCESPLAQSGALTCAPGYACQGTMGSRTCKPTQCNDGIDNNGDNKIDYPNDPGCDSISDTTEDTVCPGANCPVCSNGLDDDMDMKIDYPLDFGCSSAAGTSEAFCSMETDAVSAITTKTTSGDLSTKHQNLAFDCQLDTGNDQTYVLQLPVPVDTLTLDTFNSTVGDTVLQFWDTQCDTPAIACNDDSGSSGADLLSLITLNNVAAGNYAVSVAGYSTSNNGAFKLNVHGVVAPGTACNSALFSGGTGAVLSCPTGTSCNTTTHKCQ